LFGNLIDLLDVDNRLSGERFPSALEESLSRSRHKQRHARAIDAQMCGVIPPRRRRPTTTHRRSMSLFFPLLFGGIVDLSKLNAGSWWVFCLVLQVFPDTGRLGGDAKGPGVCATIHDMTSFVLERPPAVRVHDMINPNPSL
jgi:hypothetical protein